MNAHPLLPQTGIIPSPSSLEMNPDNTVEKKKRSCCPQAGPPGESSVSAEMTASPTLPQEPGWAESTGGAAHPRD